VLLKGLRTGLLVFFVFIGVVSARAEQASACQRFAILNTFERIQFLQVSLSPRSEVAAQFLAEPGCTEKMIDALRGFGAKINYSDEESGYVLITIPRCNLLSTLGVAGIEYAYTRDDDRNYYQDPDAKIPQAERMPKPVPVIEIPYPRVAKELAPDGPYFAAAEIGLTALWKAHPEADGRGTRVVVADEGLDLLHPELQEARDAEGQVVSKVADIGTLTTPKEDASWVQFGEPIKTSGRTFSAAGQTWTAPADGTYRFGIYKQEMVLGPEFNSPATKKVQLSVGILWDEHLNKVWVDTDGDLSFVNQRALGDFGTTHDIDWFGAKSGENDNRVPFGVKIDAAQNAAYIRIGGEHGNLVSGALAGNRWTGGLYDGAAPSAQVIDEDLSRDTMLAQIVRAFNRQDTDVINRSGGIGRSGYTGMREGIEDFAQHVIERCIEVYDKPFAAYSAAAGTIHVNDYAGPEMLRRNRQLGPPYRDTINSFVWDGLVNVVLAPSANLETDSRYKPQDLVYPDGIRYMWQDGKRNPPAPSGYVMGANNSPTIPVVSGVLADLISEAKREHVRYDAIRLNNAVFTGARLLDGIPVSRQGYGVINAANSWDQLARMAKADDPANPQLTSFTVSKTNGAKSEDVQEFHSDLVQAGEKVEGEIWITRHGGYARGRKYTLSLRGDDQSFTLLDREATFMQDKPVRVRFRASGASGWNIALLELRDAEAGVVMQDVPLSVRAPETPDSSAAGVDEYKSIIPPLTSQNLYVHMSEDVQAARFVMRLPYTGPENISTRSGPGLRYRSDKAPAGEPVDAAHHVGPMETMESLVQNDAPGNQNIYWENYGRPEYATQYDPPAPDIPISASLTVSKYAVDIERKGDALQFTDKLAAIEGRAELYDAELKTRSLTGTGLDAMGQIEATLPDHLAQWRLRVRVDGPLDGPTDVYILNCSGKNGCYVAATQEILPDSKTLTIDKPQAGAWKIVIRSRDQVQHQQTYFVQEALLTLATSIEASDSRHASRTSWTVPLPGKQSDAQYAAFRIAGAPGIQRERDGLVIAMTPLEANAP